MRKLEPNGQRAKNAINSIKVVLVLEIALLILNFRAISTEITKSIVIIDIIEGTISIIFLIAYIIYVIFFIKWFSRAYSNLHQKVISLSYSKGWAIGSWFVPILFLYRPYKIMKELYCKTRALLIEKNVLSNKNSLTLFSIQFWWFLFIVDGYVNGRVFMYKLKIGTTGPTIDIVVGIIGILLALITIKVIKGYSKMESLLFQTEDNYLDESKEELEKMPVVRHKLPKKTIAILVAIILVIFGLFLYGTVNKYILNNGGFDYDHAIAAYTEVLKIKPDDYEIWNKRGVAYYEKGDYDRAIEDYTAALMIEPNLHQALYNRGLAYHAKGNYDRAIENYTAVLKIKSDYHIALFNRGAAYSKKGDYDRAIKDFEALLKIDPNNVKAKEVLELARQKRAGAK